MWSRIIAPPMQAVPIILVPSHDDLGTNALVLSPPDCLPFAFGYDSFQHHFRLAAERHLQVEIRRLPHVALDIDEPQDLAVFAAQGLSGHSFRTLLALGIIERLAQAFPAHVHPQPQQRAHWHTRSREARNSLTVSG